MRNFLILLLCCAAVTGRAVDIAITARNFSGMDANVTDAAGDVWTLPRGEALLKMPAGDYDVAAGLLPGRTLTIPDTEFGGAVVHLWRSTNDASGLGLFVEDKASDLVSWGKGFTLGLVFFGFALVLRVVRKTVNHNPEL